MRTIRRKIDVLMWANQMERDLREEAAMSAPEDCDECGDCDGQEGDCPCQCHEPTDLPPEADDYEASLAYRLGHNNGREV